jgi:riboflavin synthase
MFTGLVSHTGHVGALRRSPEGARIDVRTALGRELAAGDSVAVNGACLTAVATADDGFSADVMAQTLSRSSLGGLEEGRRVNLELPLRAGDRLGGHFVQGHVDSAGTVESVRPDGFARRLRVAAAGEVLRYVVPRGSIAIEGVSLTAAEVDDEGLSVSLIPGTLERTTLGELEPGRAVNLEVDVLAKYVERLVGNRERAEAVAAGGGR